jgi:hypothetical protein
VRSTASTIVSSAVALVRMDSSDGVEDEDEDDGFGMGSSSDSRSLFARRSRSRSLA